MSPTPESGMPARLSAAQYRAARPGY
jgi:hypothetical protein